MNARALSFSIVPALALALSSCSTDAKPASGATPATSSSASTARPETPDGAKAAPLHDLVLPKMEGWNEEPSSGGMRQASYTVPKAEGDAEPATVVVFVFGGGVGSFEANFDRWCEQFQQPDGKPSKDVALISQTTIAGHPAQLVELHGTYAASSMGMGAAAPPKADWTMMQAFLEGSGKTWTIRLLGPAAAVERAKADFRRFLAGIQAG